jgi:hypothetical protein
VTETDGRGRLYLPEDLRNHHGERFRVVDRPSRVVPIPVDGDHPRLSATRSGIS